VNRKLRVGVIGVGTIGERHLRVYAEYHRTTVVGIADIDLARARCIATRYGVESFYKDYTTLVRRPDIEAISIATPDHLHEEPCVLAAETGKHVLVEKPLATTLQSAQRIVNAFNESQAKLGVAFANRWSPYLLEAKRVIDSGEIGEIEYFNIVLNNRIDVPMKLLGWAEKSSVLWFLGSHCIDMVRWLCGREVVSVEAKSLSRELRRRGVNTPDFYLSTLDLSGGVVARVENCWILPESMSAIYDFRTEIVGTRGRLEINASPGRVNCAHVYSSNGYTIPNFLVSNEVEGKLSGFGRDVVVSFVDRVLDDKPLLCTGQDGLAVTSILCAIEDSARSGKRVSLEGPCR